MGVLIAKVVLIPLILKTLTAISSAALIMSKISLITTGLLALKWIFAAGSGTGEQHTQFELVYVPPASAAYSKPYRHLKQYGDQSWEDSNLIADATLPKDQRKYIPVTTPYTTYKAGYGLNNAANSNLYGYNPHYYHNHQNNNDGKPFL